MRKPAFLVALFLMMAPKLYSQKIDTTYFDADHFEIEKELKAFADHFEVSNFKSKNNRTGTVERYDIHGGKVLEFIMLNNAPTGPYTRYFLNGNIMAKGTWLNSQERGESEEWYDNGQKKGLRVVVEIPRIGPKSKLLEAWDRDGNVMVANGNGLYEEKIEKTGVLRYGNYKDGFRSGMWFDEEPNSELKSVTEYGDYGVHKWTKKDVKSEEEARAAIISEPQFPGGQGQWNKHLRKNLKYPRAASEAGIQGTIEITFMVRNNGRLENIRVSKSLHPAADAEGLRIVRLSPNWIPAQENGRNVDKEMTIKIRFRLS